MRSFLSNSTNAQHLHAPSLDWLYVANKLKNSRAARCRTDWQPTCPCVRPPENVSTHRAISTAWFFVISLQDRSSPEYLKGDHRLVQESVRERKKRQQEDEHGVRVVGVDLKNRIPPELWKFANTILFGEKKYKARTSDSCTSSLMFRTLCSYVIMNG